MSFSEWNSRWQSLQISCMSYGATDRWADGEDEAALFLIKPPAAEEEVLAIEQKIKTALPESFRHILLAYSAHVDISWQLSESVHLPEAFRNIFAGELFWSLSSIPELMEIYQGWLTECFTNPDDPYDAVWYDKFPVMNVGNGDMIGIERSGERKGAVIYLSHDDGEGHGVLLGSDFEDFVDRMSRIGCVGSEDWQWLPFTSSRDSGIEPNSPCAVQWRKWFGLEI